MTEQLFLEIPGLGQVQLDPTPAMLEGNQRVLQCSWCGCVVVIPGKAKRSQIGDCPNCTQGQQWWAQRFPIAGLSLASEAS